VFVHGSGSDRVPPEEFCRWRGVVDYLHSPAGSSLLDQADVLIVCYASTQPIAVSAAAVYAAVRAITGLDPLLFVGHSMGGQGIRIIRLRYASEGRFTGG